MFEKPYKFRPMRSSLHFISRKLPDYLAIVMILLFFGGIFWINAHSFRWHTCDTYPDAYVAKLMFEQKTFFPEGFIFVNQFHIVGTPVLAAFLNGVAPDSVTAMSYASSLMAIFIIFSFIWCLRPFAEKKNLLFGVLCLVGGTVFGIRAASYDGAMIYLYTNSSFYASYLLVFILTCGCWLRIRNQIKMPSTFLIIIILLNFGIGINSPREMLVLNIPLIVLEFLMGIWNTRNETRNFFFFMKKKSFIFVLGILILNALGILLSNIIPVEQVKIISTHYSQGFQDFIARFIGCCHCILHISGLTLFQRGIKALPLFFCAVICFGLVVYATVLIFRNRDKSPLAMTILLCHLSLSAVIAAGSVYIDTRSIYYFIYYLLAALSPVYILTRTKQEAMKPIFAYTLLMISSISFVYQFYNDFKEYHYDNDHFASFVDDLKKSDVKWIFNDLTASPVLAAYSHDDITAVAVRYDFRGETESFLAPLPFFIPYDTYRDADLKQCVLCMSEWEQNAIRKHSNALFDHLELIRIFKNRTNPDKNLYVYSIKDKSIIGPPHLIK